MGALGCRLRYEVTFTNFIRLVTNPYSQPPILPLLRARFVFELVKPTDSAAVQFRDANGSLHDALDVHAWIQPESSRQQTLYRSAMTHRR